jgi:6-phosphogluconolactonase
VTLTAASFASARTVMVVIRGEQKKSLLQEAIDQGPLSSYPIGRVLAEIDVDADVFWSAD